MIGLGRKVEETEQNDVSYVRVEPRKKSNKKLALVF